MKRMILMTLMGAMAFSGSVTSTQAAGVFPYEVERHTLDNGLKVLFIPMPSDGLVSYWSVVRTGSIDEVEPGVTGFAHFFEHMMFRGSEKYPGEVYDNIVTSMGADANAYTTDDLTAYHMSITREDLPTVIDIESSRFKGLQYSEDEFKTESGAVYGEFRKGRTNPFFALYEAYCFEAFDKHTYKHTTIGFEEDIKKMPEQYEYSKSFFDRFYRPENVVLMIAGDFDSAATLKLIEEFYGDWEKGYQAPDIPVEPEQTAQRRITVPFEGQTLPILSINFKGERLLPEDATMMAAVLIPDLAFGETSPLYRKLVLDEQRVQFLQGRFRLQPRSGAVERVHHGQGSGRRGCGGGRDLGCHRGAAEQAGKPGTVGRGALQLALRLPLRPLYPQQRHRRHGPLRGPHRRCESGGSDVRHRIPADP